MGVTGSYPQYQWLKDGAIIPNATNSSYTIAAVATINAASYNVRITNNAPSSVTSSGAILTVLTGPQALFIARTNLSPSDLVISNLLAAQNFVVVVQGDRTCAFDQASGKSLIVISSSVEPGNVGQKFNATTVPIVCYQSGNYVSMYLTAVGTTNAGTVTNQMGLNIVDPSQPLAAGLSEITKVYASANQNFSFGVPSGNAFVVATTTNGTDFPVIFGYEKGANNGLNLGFLFNSRRVGLFLGDDGATNLTAAGSNLFNAAVQWAVAPPDTNSPVGISRQPADVSVLEGSRATFSVNATGAPPYYYQWQRSNTNMPGATLRSYTIASVTPADNGAQFRVIVTNKISGGSITSTVATLTVLSPNPITITNQPRNVLAALGESASFTVGITGTAPCYQWFHDGVAILNATNKIYSIGNVTSNDFGTYYVNITNRVSSTNSASAVLSFMPSSVPFMSNWRFNTNAVDLSATGWTTTNYNDSAWPVGTNVFSGTTDGSPEPLPAGTPLGTILPIRTPDGSGIMTFYFRSYFVFSNDADMVTLTSSNLIDDGAVFYLNGVEVSRGNNMPTGTIIYTTPAKAAVEANTVGWTYFNIDPYLLRQGTNVWAVEVHQPGSTSADIVFGNSVTMNFIRRPSWLSPTNRRVSSLKKAGQPPFGSGSQGIRRVSSGTRTGSPFRGPPGRF